MKYLMIGITTLLPIHLDAHPYELAGKKISEIIQAHDNLHIGCEVYSLKQQATIYTHNAHHLFIPASNTKLITSIVALETLGHHYRFETSLLTDGIIKNHTLEGNIYLKGSGDPSLQSDNIKELINNLHQAGITTITGNLFIDREDFDGEYFAPGTTVDDIGTKWMCPISCIMVDRKPLTLCAEHARYLSKDLTSYFFEGTSFFNELFRKYGIRFDGTISFQKAPKDHTILAVHQSAPLTDLVAHLLKTSDNLYADCLFKRVGAEWYDYPGTWSKGTKAVGTFIDSLGIISYDMVLKDGSGL